MTKFRKAILLSTSLSIFVQISDGQSRHLPGDIPSGSGKVTLEASLARVPLSLDDLVQHADLIVDGTVASSQPPFNWNPANSQDIATDFVVAVTNVLSGKLSSSVGPILVNQTGGKLGRWETAMAGDPLLNQGDRYIFFLVLDTRNLPNATTWPRYTVEGLWSGKARVQNGVITFAPNTAAPLRQYNGKSVANFIAEVGRKVATPAAAP